MPHSVAIRRSAGLRLGIVIALGLAIACSGTEQTSPSTSGEVATGDSLAPGSNPVDSTASTPSDSLSTDSTGVTTQSAPAGTGIPFGLMNIRASNMNSLYRATQLSPEPPYIMEELRITKAKGGRMVLKMAGKKDDHIQNGDGTFSLTKWKALVDRYRNYNLNTYIADGTLIGHFLIDEPQNAKKWGGKPLTQATVEAMAKYSKSIWPSLTTFARTPPSWLASSSTSYTYLDAGWLQYWAQQGDALTLITAQAAAARSKGLGMMTGINVLDGGNGSSKLRGWLPNHWMMTASEIRNYGNAILSSSLACGFLSWTHLYQGADYFARPDINSAMVELSNKAKAHAPTSCRQ